MQSANTVRMRTLTRTLRGTHAHTQDLGVAVVGMALLGVGVAHTDSELHVGWAVRSVVPQLSYTARLMQSESPTPPNAIEWTVTLSTFHATMLTLNADA
jgi:hypothetical protein